MNDASHDSNHSPVKGSPRQVQIRIVSHRDRDSQRTDRLTALLAVALVRNFERLD